MSLRVHACACHQLDRGHLYNSTAAVGCRTGCQGCMSGLMYALLNDPAPFACPGTQCWDCLHRTRVQDDRGRLHVNSPMTQSGCIGIAQGLPPGVPQAQADTAA